MPNVHHDRAAFPDVPGMRDAIASLRIDTLAPPDCESLEILRRDRGLDEEGRTYSYPSLLVHQVSAQRITVKALLKKIVDALTGRGHVAPSDVAPIVLGMIAVATRFDGDALESANRVIAAVEEWDVTQVWVTVCREARYDLKIGPFSLGALNGERLRHRCEMAKSDFFKRYGSALSGGWAIERDIFKTPILAFGTMNELKQIRQQKELIYALVDGYLQFVARRLFTGFWDMFRDVTSQTLAIGAPRIGAEILRQIPAQSITVFRRKDGPGGWVAPNTDVRQITIPVQDSADMVKRTHQSIFDGGPPLDGELDRLWLDYCRLLDRAWSHHDASREDEALLHAVIAFELLFSERSNTTSAVTKRVACAAHVHLGMTYATARDQAAEIYEARSRYVHSGARSSVDFLGIARLSAGVARSLLAFRRISKSDAKVADWVAKLDMIAATLEAGEPVDSGLAERSGLSPLPLPMPTES